jgi:hypothetical protein
MAIPPIGQLLVGNDDPARLAIRQLRNHANQRRSCIEGILEVPEIHEKTAGVILSDGFAASKGIAEVPRTAFRWVAGAGQG